MTVLRDQHSITYHYADGVCDMLGLSTAQQLAIRTATHLALRELAAGYEATVADMTMQLEQLRYELAQVERSPQPQDAALAALLANAKTSEAPAAVATNGTHPLEHRRPVVTEAPVISQVIAFDAEAAQESAQPDPTPAPSKAAADGRKPFDFTWGMLDDTSLTIARNLDAGKAAWRVVNADDKRVITLAVIKELQLDLPPSEILSIAQFDNRRPIWMPSFPSLSTSLGMTWKQMLAAADD